MTVASENKRNSYSGDDSTTGFDYTFRILDEDHIAVLLVGSDGTITTQTKTTHYTVSGVGEADGGTVTMLTAPATGETLIIKRNVPLKQETDYVEYDTFPAETHEEALDELTMITQQLSDRIDRCVQIPDNSILTSSTLGETALTAEYLLRINAAGTAIETVAPETAIEARIDDLTALSAVDSANDLLLIYDGSGTSLKKVTASDLLAATTNKEVNAGDAISITSDSSSYTVNVDITNETDATITASDEILFADADDANNIKKDTVQGILDLAGAGSGVTIEVDGTQVNTGASTLDFDGTDFTLTESPTDDFDITIKSERIQDIVGAMFDSNTETGISLTYQDGDGTIDAVVPDLTVAGDSGSTGMTPGDTLTVAGGTGITTSMAADTLTVAYSGTVYTDESIQDLVGAMVTTTNTETGITVTYQDATGDIDFTVSDTTVAGDSGSTGITPGDTLTIAGGTNATTAMSGDTLTVNVDDAFLSNTGDVGTGTYDFGGADDFEIPNGTTVTTDVAGQIALDTNGDGSTITTGVLQMYDGTQNTYAVSTTNYPSSDNDVPAYDSATNSVVWQAQTGGGGGLSDIVDDTTPQLGGQLDVNGNAIGDGTNELLTFTEDASAVNHVNIENEAMGSGPIISAAGDDTNIDLNLNGKATGNVVVRDGTDVTKALSFELAGATTSTTTTLTSSQTSSRTITLPDATDTLVGKATTDTFTNKTFDANGTGNSLSNVDVADLADGTDGELITWDASGSPTTVSVGTSGQVLTSNGAGAAPTFQDAAGGSAGSYLLQYCQFGALVARSSSTSANEVGLFDNITTSDASSAVGIIEGTGWYFEQTTAATNDNVASQTSSHTFANIDQNGFYSFKFSLNQSTDCIFRLGFGPGGVALNQDDPTHSIYLRYSTDESDTNFMICHRGASALTELDTSEAVSSDVYIFNIQFNGAGDVDVELLSESGTSLYSSNITTNLPSNAVDLALGLGVRTTTTAAKSYRTFSVLGGPLIGI